MTRLLTLLAVLGLLLGACGDDDDATGDDDAAEDASSEETDTETDSDDGPYSTEDYAAVLAAELQTGSAFLGSGTEEQVACVSEGFVEAIGGADALNEAGLSPEELAAAEGPADLGIELDEEAVADQLVTSFDECDYDLIRLLAESFGEGAPEGFEECLRGEITNDDVAQVFARLIIDPADQQAADPIVPKVEACAAQTAPG